MSYLERSLMLQLSALKLPEPHTQYRFDSKRKWLADFAYPDRRILVEVQGGNWSGGRHTRGQGYEQDLEKHNAAVEAGWTVFWFTGNQIKSGEAVRQLERVLRRAAA